MRQAEKKITDRIFGEMSWETFMSWWIGEFEYEPQQRVWATVSAPDENDLQALEQAHELFVKIRETETALREFAFANLKDAYLEEHGAEISATDFCGKLALDSLAFRQENGCDVAFDDGGMFGGHILVVSVDTNCVPLDVNIEG